MGFLKVVLIVIYVIVNLINLLFGIKQSKKFAKLTELSANSEDEGASSTIVGGSSSSFYEKNKSRTKEGKLKKWTIILGVAFLVLNIILSIIYML